MIKVTDSTSVLGHCCSLAGQGPTDNHYSALVSLRGLTQAIFN